MKQGRTWLGIVVVAFAALAFAPSALANTYHPNKLGDHVPDGHCNRLDCTLREAVIAANHHAGYDKIVLKAGKVYTLSLHGFDDAALKGDLDILGPVSITHSGTTRAKVDGNDVDRVFHFPGPGTPTGTFNGLVIRNGKGSNGAGIDVDGGRLRLKRSIVTGNVASGTGGGIDADVGSVSISRSKIVGNRAQEAGGVFSAVPTTISKSTVSGNTATSSYGGGVEVTGHTRIVNSTISGNSTAKDGGGVRSFGSLSLTNSTVARNAAKIDGGGIDVVTGSASTNAATIAYNKADSDANGTGFGGGVFLNDTFVFKLHNTIVARNQVVGPGTGEDAYNVSSPFTSLGHNLIGHTVGATGFGASGDRLDVSAKIATLQDNGGLTKTIALFSHSPAINHAGSGMPHRDQRGHLRNNPDIGAYER